MKSITLIIICSFFQFFSCKKNNDCVNGTIKDFTGLDGCGMMIVLDNGERLDPVSLPNNISLIPDKKVCIGYKEKPPFNTCMAGKTVKITSLKYLN